MSLLKRIGGYIVGGLNSLGEFFVNSVRSVLGLKKKPPSDKIRAALRKQWLEVGKEQEIPGVEYDGETYYDTPH